MRKIYVPPIKNQGIKTKLVPTILDNICFSEDMIWVEPFMGSGVVGFNVNPQKAIFADINPHLITFYKAIQNGEITSRTARAFLEEEGEHLRLGGVDYYYEVRDRFNRLHGSLDFLFLNRSCFNGMIRFNKDYNFNVPFGHKPNRFSKAYVTKIVNQIQHIQDIMKDKDWQFYCQPFEQTLQNIQKDSTFIYCDPPYIGRHVDYYDSWDLESEKKLMVCLQETNTKFMLSTWDYNEYRKNDYIESIWGFCSKINREHYYFVGGKESNRKAMVEALLINYDINKEP